LYLATSEGYNKIAVETSLSKSKIPVGETHYVEFCSRTGINGIDVSRVPPGLIRNAATNWRDLPALIHFCKLRGVTIRQDLLRTFSFLQSRVKPRRVSEKGVQGNGEGPSYLTLLQHSMAFPLLGEEKIDFWDEGSIEILPRGVET